MQDKHPNKNADLIDILLSIEKKKINILEDDPNFDKSLWQTIEKLGLIRILSSNNVIREINLTPLGKSIINNKTNDHENIFDILKIIINDLRNIKTALASLSLQSIQNQGDFPNITEKSTFMSNKDLKREVVTEEENLANPLKITNSTNSRSFDQSILIYYQDIINKIKPEIRKKFMNNNKRINQNYLKLESIVKDKKLNSFANSVFQSYLFVDSILNYFVMLNYEDIVQQHIDKKLIEKISWCENLLPVNISLELINFLDEFKNDFESDKKIKIGQKTFNKIFQQVKLIYKNFSFFIEQVY